jgi:hypothetical protein
MADGFSMTSAYTYARGIDWWAGGIAIPEFWDLNKGTQGGNTPHKFDLSAIYELPFGVGKPFLNNEGVLAKILGGWQLNSYFTATRAAAVTAGGSLNARQPAGCRSGEVGCGDPWRRRPRQPVLRSTVPAGHQRASAPGSMLRGPGIGISTRACSGRSTVST